MTGAGPAGEPAPTRRNVLKGVGAAAVAGLVAGVPPAARRRISERPTDPAKPDPPLSLPLVAAQPAERLVQHYALNTRFRYADTVYGYTDEVLDLVAELGVRTVRERITTDASVAGTRALREAMPRLARDHGTRWHATCLTMEDIDGDYVAEAQAIRDELTGHYARQAPDGDLTRQLHSVGGPNEVNGPLYHDEVHPQWYDAARVLQATLWNVLRSPSAALGPWVDANGGEVLVAGPSTRSDTTPGQMSRLGDLRPLCDLANAHLYQAGVSPTKNVDHMINVIAASFGDYRRLFTEAGYNDSPQTNAARTVPEWVANIYAPRAPCDYFRRKSVYFRFELMDDPDRISRVSQTAINATADIQAHFGMVAMTSGSEAVSENSPSSWRKKAEFHTMRRWIRLLSDRDPFTFKDYSFAPVGLRYDLLGRSPDLQELLVQKRDGRHYLLLWRDVDVYDPAPDARVDLRQFVESVHLRLRLARRAVVRMYKPAADGEAESALVHSLNEVPPGGSFEVSLDYDLQLLEIDSKLR